MRPLVLAAVLIALSACRSDPEKPDTDTVDNPDDTGPSVVDADGDGYTTDTDCDDDDASVHPDADELCDGIDNDCDDVVDEDAIDATTWYMDADGDGWGDPNASIAACAIPDGYVDVDGDCDDSRDDIYPDAPERCDGIDNDCDGLVDEDLNELWYADADADGYGNPERTLESCDPGAGWVVDATDCDDGDSSVNPGAAEVCNDGDDDCDGLVDEDLESTFYADEDGDGFGDPDSAIVDCEPGAGWAADDQDCDDANSSIHPDATEICDTLDNDCDGLIDDADDSITGTDTWYADGDGDGFGDDASTSTACEQPSGYAAYGGDCDDADPAYNPGAAETDCTDPADYNCDGSSAYADMDGDGFAACEECDDSDAAINPSAAETCDRVDNDCDGVIDEDDATDAASWYADADGDGYGDPTATTAACDQPTGYVGAAYATDCDDTDASVSPVDPELCDGVDNDCDGDTDEGVTTTFYADADADGYGDPSAPTEACTAPSGFTTDDADCDDGEPATNPAASELCDGADNDCDGAVDESDAGDASTWYRDGDADGYGDSAAATVSCEAPSGYTADDADCDDRDDDIFPGADEHCDGVDEDCDGAIDDAPVDADTWYADADGDGFGDGASATTACTQPTGFVADQTDCDDGDLGSNPDATELCDGADNDCDGDVDEDDAADAGTWYLDHDTNGYGGASVSTRACLQPSGYLADATDCDDTDASSYPGADELCDGADNDCDGTVDEAGALDEATWYADSDGDGDGDPASTQDACSQPSGHVSSGNDCDDGDATINPGADELCDAVDNDCDGLVDDDDPDISDASDWYADADADGFGDAATTVHTCEGPSGWVADDTDCDDTMSTVSPDSPELYDSLDNDCDGDVDEDLWVGTGADGDLEVTGTVVLATDMSGSRSEPDAVSFPVTAISGATITVTGTVAGLAPGDEVLLINMQGSDAAHSSVGAYEFGSVDAVSGSDVTLAEAVAEVYGESGNTDLSDQVIVLQRVPHYQDVTVYAGGTLTTEAWDGAMGGVLAFRAAGALWIEDTGVITVSELGYMAGDTGTCNNCDAFQGESIAGEGVGDEFGSPYNEAIGGFLANYGGGGANVTGGGGNHGGGATAGDSWNYGGYTAPEAGIAYGQPTLATAFLGSGGGGVWNGGYDDVTEDPGPGGDGAGILYIGCGLLLAEGHGALQALGGTTDHWSHGSWTYGAGGGAGGTIFLIAEEVELATDSVSAEGGFGEATHLRLGGDGGRGRVRIDCTTCNGFAHGSADANRALDDAAEPDPGYTDTPT